MADVVRAAVAELYGDEVAQATRILYGGSTNADNIAEIMQQPDIDGALIGGAALKSDAYVSMVKTTADLYAAAAVVSDTQYCACRRETVVSSDTGRCPSDFCFDRFSGVCYNPHRNHA